MHLREIILSAGLLMALASSAHAASILVNTADDELNDDGDCSLREAVHSANTNPVSGVDACNSGDAGADTITIMVNGTIQITSQIEVTEALSIQGLGMDATVLSGNFQTRHFLVNMPDDSNHFSISGLTLRDGRASTVPPGSGINGGGSIAVVERTGELIIDSVRFTGNRTIATPLPSLGGAILVSLETGVTASIEVRDSNFDRNWSEAGGGALHARAEPGSTIDALTIARTRFELNQTEGSGGAIDAGIAQFSITDSVFENNVASSDDCCNRGGALDLRPPSGSLNIIERTSFIENVASSSGGALDLDDGTTLIRNATFYGNQSAEGLGQALQLSTGASAAVFFSTFQDNGESRIDDSAIWVCGSCSLDLLHSIVWASWSPTTDCQVFSGSSFTSHGFNIDSSGTCTTENTDLPQTDPELLPLGDYGGSTPGLSLPTLLPAPESPAVDGGAGPTCPGPLGGSTEVDQRGRPRPASPSARGGTPCDIGAIEYQPGDHPILFHDRFESAP